MHNAKDLRNKVIVITGASSGVGRAAALEMARHGAHIVLAARREEALNDVAEECRAWGADALVVPTDVTDAGQVNTLANTAQHWGGKIDVWINNAGLLAAGAFDETPASIHRKVIETNLLGYINGAYAVLPHFKAQDHGLLLNNISVGGFFPVPYAAAYSASKFGLRGFGEALQGELTHYPHIHVCNLYPAFLDTPGIQHAANYSGKYLKPAPPVFDPQKVGAAAVGLAKAPRETLSIGFVSPLLKMAHGLFPAFSRTATALSIEGYLKVAKPLPHTPGNVFEPVEFGTGIHGGWNSQADAKKRKQTSMLVLAGLALGWMLLSARK